jgi:dTMP kinase
MKGLLITFEGGEGAGKTTLIKGVSQALKEKGGNILETRAPGGTPFGDKMRSLLLDGKGPLDERAELFLFLADRAQHVQEVINPALAEGKIVLCDRFNDSTVAYQGVARELDSDYVRSLCLFAGSGLQPDLTFYLDIEPEIGLRRAMNERGVKDRLESESLSFHKKIRGAFHAMAKEEPSRIYQLDGELSPDTILKQALDRLYALSSSCR